MLWMLSSAGTLSATAGMLLLLLLLLKGEVIERVRFEGLLEAEIAVIEWFLGECVLVRVFVDDAVAAIDVVDVNGEIVEELGCII